MRILCRRGGGLSHLLLLLCHAIVFNQSNAFTCSPKDCPVWRSCSTRLHLVTDNNDSTAKPRVRYSTIPDDAATAALVDYHPVDSIVSLIASDLSSIALGLAGILIVLINRSSLDDSTPLADLERETRSSLLALVACGSVLVNGVSRLNVESVLAEPVSLEGMNSDLVLTDEDQQSSLEWVVPALLTATPCSSVVYLKYLRDAWSIVAAAGVLPMRRGDELTMTPLTVSASTPILDRLRNDGSQQETYLPTLQNLPGRTEFTYLPENTQAVVLVPVGLTGVLVLGSNRAKSFTPRDIAWSLSVATRINE